MSNEMENHAMNLDKLLVYAKAHIALVGTALTWYLAHYPTGPLAHYASIATGLLTVLGVLLVPNKSATSATRRGTSAGSVTLSVIADTSAFRAEIQRLAADLAKIGNPPAVTPVKPKVRHSTKPAK